MEYKPARIFTDQVDNTVSLSHCWIKISRSGSIQQKFAYTLSELSGIFVVHQNVDLAHNTCCYMINPLVPPKH